MGGARSEERGVKIIDAHRLTKNPDAKNSTETEWTVYKNLIAEHENRQLKLVGHRWMENRFSNFNTIEDIAKPTHHLKEFIALTSIKSYKMYNKTGDARALERYLEKEIIDFYYKRSLNIVNPDNFELRYINKN